MKRILTLALAVITLLGCTVFPAVADGTAKVPVNLYDFYQSTSYSIDAGGGTVIDSTVSANGAIPVTGGKTVYFGPCAPDSVHLAAYGENGVFIEKVEAAQCTEHATLNDGVVYSYVLPENAGYVWTAAENKFAFDYIFTCGEPFGADELNGYHDDNTLKGKSALFVGDSICHGTNDSAGDHYGWAGRIGDANDMDWVNNGQSGYSVSTCRQYSAGVIINKLLETKDRDFDYVLLHGGVNDAWDRVAIGTVSSGYAPAGFNKATFAGGLENLFYNAYLYYGDTAAIGYLINFSMPTAGQPSLREMKPYFEMAKKICDKWNVRYFDMFENTKVFTDMKIGTTSYIPDYVHPNAAGYDILAPMIEGFMKTLEVRDMPDGKTEDDGAVYNVTFADNDGNTLLTTTATASGGLAQEPDTSAVTEDCIVKRKFSGWSFAGRLYGSLDYYKFAGDRAFRSAYTEYYGARLEDHPAVKLPKGEGAALTASALSLLPETVALGTECTGLSLVYKVEGADSEIIADDLMISLAGEYLKPAWQWGDHLYREPDVASPNNLTLKNGLYYIYLNKNIVGNGSVLTRFNIFNKHELHYYNDVTVREPVNSNENATFQLLAVTPDNLQPTATFHDAQGKVIATYQHKYTDIHRHLGYSPSGVLGSYQSGELLTVEDIAEKTGVTPPEKAPTHDGKVTYEFEGWADEKGDTVEGFYYNCALYPSYRIASDERAEFTVTFIDGEEEYARVTVKSGEEAKTETEPEKATENFTKYTFAGWVDAEGNEADLSAVTADITVYAVYEVECDHSFTDVEDGRFYTEAVEWALMNGVMNGTSETTFDPNGVTNRAMIVTVLYRLQGEPDVSEIANPFTDVEAGKYYEAPVKWAYDAGVVTGISETEFAPTAELTREQFATILYRYAGEVDGRDVSVAEGADLSAFEDEGEVSAFAREAMLWANTKGLITGTGESTLSPKSGTTRAQMATILYRYIDLEEEPVEPVEPVEPETPAE